MRESKPSRTAFGAAAHRGLHQVLDGASVFADPLALRILGTFGLALRVQVALGLRPREARRRLRLFVCARSAVAEARLAAGVETRGVTQMVVLGAGLDTFAYRNPFEGRLRVFEVDHPATQAWKLRRLARAKIAVPASLTFVPVDFERDSLGGALAAAGLDPDRRTFFAWLGVVPYLTREAVTATLALIGALPGGGEVVFDYSDPPATFPAAARAAQARLAARVARLGEPFLTRFEPADLRAELIGAGLTDIEDLGPEQLAAVDGPPAGAPERSRGGHVVFAATPRRP